jgi:hypothetical protein
MSKEIVFTNVSGVEFLHPPEPASKSIPDWYKDMESYIGGKKKPTGDAGTSATIKRCMPVFDSITSGYIIKSPSDVYVTQKEEAGITDPWWEWASNDLITFHTIQQAPTHPANTGHKALPKWTNPWSIKTPKGYSCLFIQPMHRESPFTIMPGIVDTDTYQAPVNFPFVLNDIKFEGIIPAGTPIAQVIPFKRDSFSMRIGNQNDYKEQDIVLKKTRSRFFDSYKNQFWNKKEYK